MIRGFRRFLGRSFWAFCKSSIQRKEIRGERENIWGLREIGEFFDWMERNFSELKFALSFRYPKNKTFGLFKQFTKMGGEADIATADNMARQSLSFELHALQAPLSRSSKNIFQPSSSLFAKHILLMWRVESARKIETPWRIFLKNGITDGWRTFFQERKINWRLLFQQPFPFLLRIVSQTFLICFLESVFLMEPANPF